MKSKILHILLLVPFMSIAQEQIPQFQMTYYFEDAVGNKDSLILGYDEESSDGGLNSIFGEQAITTPFDSVFEVRALINDIGGLANSIFSKKRISNGSQSDGGCINGSGSKIFMQCKHYPVTISWDNTVFDSTECHRYSYFSSSVAPYFLGPNEIDTLEPEWYQCTWGQSSITEAFDDPDDGWYYIRDILVEGNDTVFINVLSFFVQSYVYGNPLCGVSDIEQVMPAASVKVAPNPVNSLLYVTLATPSSKAQELHLYNVTGQLLRSESLSIGSTTHTLDVVTLPSGLYFWQVGRESGKVIIQH